MDHKRISKELVTVKCSECGKVEKIPFSLAQEEAYDAGGLIQRVAPELTDNQREVLISQICGKCFDALFAEEL